MWSAPFIGSMDVSIMNENYCYNGSGTNNTCENGSGEDNTCRNGSSSGEDQLVAL